METPDEGAARGQRTVFPEWERLSQSTRPDSELDEIHRFTSTPPPPAISDHGFLSNCHSAALVDRDGSIEWACFHRFDHHPVFARILDRGRGGFFRVAPDEPYTVTRRYLPGTNVLETRFACASGIVTLTDALLLGETPFAPGRIRRDEPNEFLVRHLRCVEGTVRVALDFQPRFDCGLTTPLLQQRGPGAAVATGGADALLLQSQLRPLETRSRANVFGRETLHAGDERLISIEWAESARYPRWPRPPEFHLARLKQTIDAWQDWSRSCTYDGPFREAVLRSALVLKGLTNSTTGAIAAAPTTSLPETIGGIRNWDYRFSWLRDSVATLQVLLELGYRHEAAEFARWLTRTTAGNPRDLQIMYGLAGERLLHEIELAHLDGYRRSRPVRLGNGAWNQFQLDTYGELVAAAWLYYQTGLTRHLAKPSAVELVFLHDVMESILERWREPDEGIWEVRHGPRHFVYSKLMAWAGLDRGVRLFRALGVAGDCPRWERVRDEIRHAIETVGVDPATGAFVQAFGSREVDASTLQVLMWGFLPPGDPRVVATIREVEKRLTHKGHVFRYLGEDGLAGHEGAFVYCSAWLASAYALSGRVEDAEMQLARVVACANDLGLLSEEVAPATGEQLGNFPQGFSHVGVIEAAVALSRARKNREAAAAGSEVRAPVGSPAR